MTNLHGVVLLPSREWREHLTFFARSLPENELPLGFDLAQPHVTLIQGVLEEPPSPSELVSTLGNFLQPVPSTTEGLRVVGQHQGKPLGWLTLGESPQLREFHYYALGLLSSLFKPGEMPTGLNQKEQRSFALTGCERNCEAFVPHVTVSIGPKELPTHLWKGKKLPYEALAFVRHGDRGEIEELLAVHRW